MSLQNVRNVVLVLSGKGGVGKSSITIQLALSLSLSGKSVGILDVDLTGPSIPRLLGLEDSKITQAPGGWLPAQVHSSQILPPLPPSSLDTQNGQSNGQTSPPLASANGASSPHPQIDSTSNDHPPQSTTPQQQPIGSLHAISLAFLLPSRSAAVIWRGPKKTAMIRQFLSDVLWPATGIDYLLIDTPPGTSDEHIALAETLLSSTTTTPIPPDVLPAKPTLAGAVVVTTPQAVATADVKKELNFCRKTAIPVIGVVENMAGFVCECCGEETALFGSGGGESMATEFGVPFLGRVGLDGAWGRLVEEGRRPRYGAVDVNGDANGEGGDGAGESGTQMDQNRNGRERDEGLLVDKYRSCRLSEAMKDITEKVIRHVERSS